MEQHIDSFLGKLRVRPIVEFGETTSLSLSLAQDESMLQANKLRLSELKKIKDKGGIRERYRQPVRGRKERGMFVRSPNIFFFHAVTKSCMGDSDVRPFMAGGKQKLRAALD